MMNAATAWTRRFRINERKYRAVTRVTVRNQLAYGIDVVVRSLFLVVILYIFMQLWTVTYHGTGASTIAGYSFEQLIWYLIVSESIIMGTPRLTLVVEEEVKTGAIAYLLVKPVHYVHYQYASFMGEALFRTVVNLAIGGALGISVFGLPPFGWGWLAFWPVVVLAFTINFTLRMSLALCAFWVEETQGLTFVYDKLLFTIGGMMLPIELFPDALQRVCAWLPFQAVVYYAAKTVVHFDAHRMVGMMAAQLLWIAGLSVLLSMIYRKGVSRLNVNGG